MRLNHFSRRFLAAATAVGDGQESLDFAQGTRAAVDDFADLAIADAIAEADVHGA